MHRDGNLFWFFMAIIFFTGCGQGLQNFTPQDGISETPGEIDSFDWGTDQSIDGKDSQETIDYIPENEVDFYDGCECSIDEDCQNNLACDGEEICDGCHCISGEPIVCNDGIDCTHDSCIEPDGNCQFIPDSNLCNTTEICDPNSGCIPAPQCEHDEDCDNGIYCDGEEQCDPSSNLCTSGIPVNCDDGINCTEDNCDEENNRCLHTPVHSRCNDSQFCTIDRCDLINGCQYSQRDCSDTFNCTIDSCNEGSDRCEHTPDDSRCDDGLNCTNERCSPVSGGDPSGCVRATIVCPTDGLDCTDDNCQEEGSERCSYPILPGKCLIDGVCYNSGDSSPDSPCLGCNPLNSQTEWTALGFGTRCDDGDDRTVLDHCGWTGECAGCLKMPLPECSDSWDNNGNGVADWENEPGCTGPIDIDEDGAWLFSQCSNFMDDDTDGRQDFGGDSGCTVSIDSNEGGREHRQCNDGIDNDADTLIDFPDDPGCSGFEGRNESAMSGSISACNNGRDDDGDGLTDMDDHGCISENDNDEFDCDISPMCSDGIDNDGDGLIDFPQDPGCFSRRDDDETDAPTVASECSDGIDNDSDGSIDTSDRQCISGRDNSERI